MHGITSTFIVLLCTFLKAESLLFHGQTNATSVSSGHSDPDVYKQLLNLQTVLISLVRDQKQQALQIQQFEQQQRLLNGEIQMLKQWNRTAQTKITILEDSLIDVQKENKILKERLDNLNTSSTSSQQDACLTEKMKNLNSTSTFLLQENIILKDQIQILNSTSMLIQRNMTTSEDLRKMESILTFEIEQTVRDIEEKMMQNISATVTDLELRDRYLSLSLLDVHSNMTSLNHTLLKFKQQQNMTIQNLSLSLLDVHNNTAGLSSSLSSLDAQQKRTKSEIQMLTNLQQNDITKLNDTIIHLKNRVPSNVAFTAGIIGETARQHIYTGTVKFPKVIYQVGGGYNPTTGVFTAPKAGLYLIFCTNVAAYHETFWTKIMINGSVKAGVMALVSSSSMLVHQSASNLVVHQLQAGDRVWIQVYQGTRLYSYIPDTTFSVIMINGSD